MTYQKVIKKKRKGCIWFNSMEVFVWEVEIFYLDFFSTFIFPFVVFSVVVDETCLIGSFCACLIGELLNSVSFGAIKLYHDVCC